MLFIVDIIQMTLIYYIHVCLLAERRNSLGSDLMFVGKSHPLFDFIHELYRTESNEVTTHETTL